MKLHNFKVGRGLRNNLGFIRKSMMVPIIEPLLSGKSSGCQRSQGEVITSKVPDEMGPAPVWGEVLLMNKSEYSHTAGFFFFFS